MRFYCQPCEHRWYQHRHPNLLVRKLGAAMAAAGFLQICAGLGLLVSG